MIRPIQITLNAAHPELPLIEASTYVGSPSTAFVRGVPAAIGNWKITAVRVIFHYPDESVVAAACVNSATGVWVGTIAPTATSGRVANGYQVLADGTDENGDAVTGYVLGMGDLAVYTRDMTIDAGGTVWYLHYFDTAPTTPQKGDVAPVDGVLKLYNGSAWESFAAGVTLDDAVTRTSANGVKSSGIWAAIWGALTALPSGFTSLYDWCVAQLAGKASTADATLTERYGSTQTAQWTITYPQVWAHGPVYITWFDEFAPIGWVADCDGDRFGPFSDNPNATTLTGEVFGETITATRTALPGYQLGSQSTKPIASEAEAEALRQGKADKPATSTNNNLAALDTNGNLKDSGKKPSDFATAEQGGKADDVFGLFEEVPGYTLPALRLTGFRVPWGNAGYIEFVNGGVHFYHPAGQGSAGVDYTTAWPFKAGTFATTGDVSAKANDAAIAPEFDASASYAVGDVVMYNGSRYRCTTAHSGAWAAADFTAESVQEAMDAGGGEVKPTRIYNESGTDALDDKGRLFKSSMSGNFFKQNNTYTYEYSGKSGSGTGVRYNYNGISYYPNSGNVEWTNGGLLFHCETGKDPTVPGTVLTPDSSAWVYTPLASSMESAPYARFALESMPTAWAADTTYNVGVCASNGGAAYRCNTANSDASWTAAHWDEIPVLSQKADAADLRYALTTKSIDNGAVSLDDRAINAVSVSSSLASLTVNFPAATSGKARDFGVRLTVASGITTAPQLVLPQGVTCENADGTAPEIGADGAATILYFTETASGVFLVKGEVVQTIS